MTVLWIVVFWRLGYPSLLDPDEAHYAQLTREMMRTHQWMVPLLDGAPFIDKPVLFHWLQAAFVTLLGPSEFAFRLPSALAAVGLIATTRWIGARLFGAKVGDLSALMFATLPLTFALSSVAVFDMLYVTFLFVGVACLLIAAFRGPSRLQYVGFALVALAVMTKGPVALALLTLFVVAAVTVDRRARDPLSQLHWVRGLAVISLVAAPWFLWMWIHFGNQFTRDYLVVGNLWYFTNPATMSNRSGGFGFYARAFFAGFFPWSLVTLGGGLDSLRQWRNGSPAPPERILLWIWVGVVVAFFSAAGFKVDYYIFPAAPACCILAAVFWVRAASAGNWRWTGAALATIATVLVVAGGISAFVLLDLNLGLTTAALLLPLALTIGGALLAIEIAEHQWQTPATISVPLVTLLASYTLVVQLGFPVIERSRPTAPVGRWITAHTAADAVVGEYGLDDWRASIRYYTDRRIAHLRDPDDLRRFISGEQMTYVLMLRQDFEALRENGLRIEALIHRPAIVGRTGRFLRRQVWGELLVVGKMDPNGTTALNFPLRTSPR